MNSYEITWITVAEADTPEEALEIGKQYLSQDDWEPFSIQLLDVKDPLEENWRKIASILVDAFSIAWDGCHKIYILMDETQHKQMIEYEYDPLLRLDALGIDVALRTLHEWYDASCGLRFINAVHTVEANPNEGFTTLIGQFEGNVNEEDVD